ncbi:bifunctional riboflavin kinase/FAD synthetase [Heliophilum fasciatum]|uniref:Riboflavin biosynthesis protein n=1 Tax=Heliophilum fasciatum TaxID=35700 RepID=A0A4R2RPA0_9FIRM|nr:bifunctional riboflavin kinase/FAD synthetase [Heliophilum fasciatum]MCW2277891.1 riboflavin kinase/FMN adenylyltransferase [Heliophilum fasciatum]TCP64539.1 FMN adenylyltransferase /riboflavin kinase [Heliophilum fasciatum]
MKTIIYNGPLDKHYSSVHVALGNFDGVHLGHQRLIQELVKDARRHDGTAIVATFDPHPLRVMRTNNPPKMLTPTLVKASLISQLGVDLVLLLPFDTSLAQMTPETFVDTVLAKHLRAQLVVVGFNYSFGHGGKGTPQRLWELGRHHHMRVKVIDEVTLGGVTVSSTRIRELMALGEVEQAGELLGYAPILQGKVVTGEQRGRTMGFPTANLQVAPEQFTPGHGVYTAWVNGGPLSPAGLMAVVNIGTKPTFTKEMVETIEAHIPDFSGDLYGQTLTVHLLKRIRPEKRFRCMEQLIDQIEQDIFLARQHVRTDDLAPLSLKVL